MVVFSFKMKVFMYINAFDILNTYDGVCVLDLLNDRKKMVVIQNNQSDK